MSLENWQRKEKFEKRSTLLCFYLHIALSKLIFHSGDTQCKVQTTLRHLSQKVKTRQSENLIKPCQWLPRRSVLCIDFKMTKVGFYEDGEIEVLNISNVYFETRPLCLKSSLQTIASELSCLHR